MSCSAVWPCLDMAMPMLPRVGMWWPSIAVGRRIAARTCAAIDSGSPSSVVHREEDPELVAPKACDGLSSARHLHHAL